MIHVIYVFEVFCVDQQQGTGAGRGQWRAENWPFQMFH